ncbi:Hypothetical protein A7982_04982 [Minicystis rosea]|nr:Hypothetical protein A7982_04982 [Minicystis rosea]
MPLGIAALSAIALRARVGHVPGTRRAHFGHVPDAGTRHRFMKGP